ncbi:MAG: SufS family cysteine desulfurase [Candidatus Eremiobacteraeota bacterium]|nr:SufS family cysteine desulfurase [Candidatus Eremiobacteraeota bacterium]MBV8366240.1 SufS family cysteine desulfurase [Candidatus Eremiobacteraeota bacterium]
MSAIVKPQTQGLTQADVARIRANFPILAERPHGKQLVFLDSAASSQKPVQVIEAMDDYYRRYHANIHRGVYHISELATEAYEEARASIARFIGTPCAAECIYVRNATEGLNLVAYSWGRSNLKRGDAILLTEMEHHSNLVPWQVLAQQTGAQLRFVPVADDGRLDLHDLDNLLDGVRLFAFTAVSNTLGTINPVRDLAARARAAGAVSVVDACQAVPRMPVDVTEWGADFIAFSGHKMLGPTGIGILWGRKALLDAMPPFLTGGGMIGVVELTKSTYADVPARFEAGTPAIAEAVGLAAAVRYLEAVGMERIHQYELSLAGYALERLAQVPAVKLYGPPMSDRTGVISMTVGDIHAHDLASILDSEGVCVRAGHHCNQPLMEKLGVPATARASFYLYNTPDEVDALVSAIEKAKRIFKIA